MAQSIEKLEEIINNPKSKPEAVAIAKKQLEGLTAISAAKTNVTAQMMGETAQLDTILSALQSLISSGVGGGLNEKEIKKAIRQELKAKKVDFDDLSDYLKGFLDNLKSVRNVQITINAMDLVTQVTSSGDPILNLKITQLIL
jgi:hypothetical protein